MVPAEPFGVTANPAEPSYAGWCEPGYLDVQGPGGISKVPVAGAVQAVSAIEPKGGGTSGQCDMAALGAVKGTMAAAFFVSPQDDYVALFTTDSGTTWSFVPVPLGAARLTFESFAYSSNGAIEAFYYQKAGTNGNGQVAPLVEMMSASGAHWAQVPFSCPADGPCLSFGADASQGCGGMGATYLPLLSSSDAGKHWSQVLRLAGRQPQPFLVSTCSLDTLVALSPDDALLVAGAPDLLYDGVFPVLLTTDGGAKWEVISLPAPSGPNASGDTVGPDLVVLPDGALLHIDQLPWQLLRPGTNAWCSVAHTPTWTKTGFDPVMTTLAGSDLWSLTGDGAKASAHEVNVSSLACR
jgi:hypothetical protein